MHSIDAHSIKVYKYEKKFEYLSFLKIRCRKICVKNCAFSSFYGKMNENIYPTSSYDPIHKNQAERKRIYILGDLNFPGIKWLEEDGVYYADLTGENKKTQAEEFQNFMTRWCLDQVNPYPTRKGNVLDLVLTNNSHNITNMEIIPVKEEIEMDDHDIVKATFRKEGNIPESNSTSIRGQTEGKLSSREYRNVTEETWEKLNERIEEHNWEEEFKNNTIEEKTE